jgi:hypothetical protein
MRYFTRGEAYRAAEAAGYARDAVHVYRTLMGDYDWRWVSSSKVEVVE